MAADDPDHRTEVMLGNLLRYGVLLAAAVTAGGGGVYLYRHGDEPADYARFDSAATEKLRSPRGIVEESLRGRGRALVQLGVLLLIATPVARVAFSALAFARQRDYTYVALTLFVLAVLLCSLFVGGG